VIKPTGFVENEPDPCLLSNWNWKEVILIGIYVDDYLVIGNEERIQWLIVELKRNDFNLKVENNLNDCLSLHVIEGVTESDHTSSNSFNQQFARKFGNEVLEKRTYRTSGTPRFKVIRPDQDLELIDPEF
jgi:hypothetical protein